jgi:hypothetical protein
MNREEQREWWVVLTEKKRIYKTSGGRKSPFRTGVVATTERREFATPVFLFEYIEA